MVKFGAAIVISAICILFPRNSYAQVPLNDSSVLIRDIEVSGNKHTKTFIILREIKFKAGDVVAKRDLSPLMELARNQVMNTNLFAEVSVDSVPQPDSSLIVRVAVKEKWYIYPTPQFRITDRSFQEWYKVYNADFRRVVYGLRVAHYNLTGRRDPLRVTLLTGYARNFSLSYANPFIDKKRTLGYSVSATIVQNREIPYATSYGNRLLNFKKEGFVRNYYNGGVGIVKRKGYFKSIFAGIGVSRVEVNDSILSAKYNPGYFNDSSRKQTLIDMTAGVTFAKVDNINYPQKGFTYVASVSKRNFGFRGGLNALTLSGSVAKYVPLGKNYFLALNAQGMLRLPFKQAYYNRSALGYGGFNLRGLDVYVIDGVAAVVGKSTLAKKMFDFSLPLPFNLKIKKVSRVPFTFYAKTFGDAGYSYAQSQFRTNLSNRLLYTGGFGLDIVTIYNIVFKIDYNFNQLGENGLLLRGKGGF